MRTSRYVLTKPELRARAQRTELLHPTGSKGRSACCLMLLTCSQPWRPGGSVEHVEPVEQCLLSATAGYRAFWAPLVAISGPVERVEQCLLSAIAGYRAFRAPQVSTSGSVERVEQCLLSAIAGYRTFWAPPVSTSSPLSTCCCSLVRAPGALAGL